MTSPKHKVAEKTRKQTYRELEEAYKEYYAQPGAAAADREVVAEMLVIAVWGDDRESV